MKETKKALNAIKNFEQKIMRFPHHGIEQADPAVIGVRNLKIALSTINLHMRTYEKLEYVNRILGAIQREGKLRFWIVGNHFYLFVTK